MESRLFQPLIRALMEKRNSGSDGWIHRSIIADHLRATGQWPVKPFVSFQHYSRAAAEHGYVILSRPVPGGGPNLMALAVQR